MVRARRLLSDRFMSRSASHGVYPPWFDGMRRNWVIAVALTLACGGGESTSSVANQSAGAGGTEHEVATAGAAGSVDSSAGRGGMGTGGGSQPVDSGTRDAGSRRNHGQRARHVRGRHRLRHSRRLSDVRRLPSTHRSPAYGVVHVRAMCSGGYNVPLLRASLWPRTTDRRCDELHDERELRSRAALRQLHHDHRRHPHRRRLVKTTRAASRPCRAAAPPRFALDLARDFAACRMASLSCANGGK